MFSIGILVVVFHSRILVKFFAVIFYWDFQQFFVRVNILIKNLILIKFFLSFFF